VRVVLFPLAGACEELEFIREVRWSWRVCECSGI